MSDQISHSAPLGAERVQERLREIWIERLRRYHCEHGDNDANWCGACQEAFADDLEAALAVAPVVAQEPGSNVTIRCIGCGRDIWWEAAGYTTLDQARQAECSDCFLDRIRPSSPSSGSAHEKNDTTTKIKGRA